MGGAVSLLGIPASETVTIERFAADLIFKGLSLQAVIGRRIFSTWDRMLALLADGLDLRPLVSREYEGLDAFVEGMEAFDAHEALKVVFYPHGKNGDGRA
jgi:threonine 3-dehydrogenase